MEQDRWEDHIHIAGQRRYEEEFMDDHKDSIVQTYCAHTKPLPTWTVISYVVTLAFGIVIGGIMF